MRRLISLVPQLLALLFVAVLAVIGAMTVLRPVLEPRLPAFYREPVKVLMGMQSVQASPPLALDTLFSGSYQKSADGALSAALFQRATLVRAFNEAQWRLFGTSYMASGSLVRGRDSVLFEESYIDAYCGLRLAVRVQDIPRFTARLRVVQDWFERRGQRFVYVLAPTKTTWFPSAIPRAFHCASQAHDHTYGPAQVALTRAGINWIDGRAILLAARRRAGFELFPRNGIHWNRLGQALADRALIEKLRSLGMTTLTPLTWDLSAGPDEVGSERDLSELLNLWARLPAWPTPLVTAHRSAPAAKPLTLTAVNDSFFDPMALMLTEAGDFDRIRDYGYLTLSQVEYHEGAATSIKSDRARIVYDLTHSDVVVLEEVESRPGGPFSVEFLDMIEAVMGGK